MLAQVTALPDPRHVEQEHNEGMLVCLLGSFRLLRKGQPLETLIAGKPADLLAALALHLETGVSRDALLELLWPQQETDHAADSLHSLIYSLHRRLRSVL